MPYVEMCTRATSGRAPNVRAVLSVSAGGLLILTVAEDPPQCEMVKMLDFASEQSQGCEGVIDSAE